LQSRFETSAAKITDTLNPAPFQLKFGQHEHS
jgi:hypothetical protein